MMVDSGTVYAARTAMSRDHPQAPPRIDYDELVSNYHENLLTVLRGFSAGSAFLDTWVPDSDDHTSLLNLVESAHAAGLAALSVEIGSVTWDRLDLDKLTRLLAPLASVRAEPIGERTLLEVRFAGAI
jgi:hypothetical protein